MECIDQCSFFFFFQAEDGIRDVAVTGVQTCALPISPLWLISPTAAVAWKWRHSRRALQECQLQGTRCRRTATTAVLRDCDDAPTVSLLRTHYQILTTPLRARDMFSHGCDRAPSRISKLS